MQKRTLIGAAAFSLALAGGGIAGAVLGTPGVSGAQDGTTSTTTADAGAPADRPDHPRGFHPRLEALEVAAKVLGMEPADLRAELEAGKSIAAVAEEQGIDEQKVVDAIVADGTARLQEQITKLPDRATELVEREGLPERPDGRGPGHDGGPPPAGAPDDAPDGSGNGSTSS